MPAPTGNTYVAFVYDSTIYKLQYANISSYEHRPIYAEDGFTLIRYEVHVAGSALISDGLSTYTELASRFQNGTGTDLRA